MSIAETTTKPLIKTSILLSRLPLITREPSAFERQYKQYQYDLEKRLMWTFPTYFYFKKGTVAEHKFESVQKRPIRKVPGVYYARGEPDVRHNRERSMRQDIVIPRDNNTNDNELNESIEDDGNKEESEKLSRRIVKRSVVTKADEINDTLSLERKLRNHLYLLVSDTTLTENKSGDSKNMEKKATTKGIWQLPQFTMNPKYESLYENVSHGLKDMGGKNMKTWIISNKPIAVIENKLDEGNVDIISNFVLKSHIIAGKFIPINEKMKYQWLTKQEISQLIDPVTYKKIECFLDD